MSFLDLQENEIKEEIRTLAKSKLGLMSLKPSGVLTALIEFLAASMAYVYNALLKPLYANVSLDGASGFYLDMWGRLLGLERLQAIKAVVQITATARASGKIEQGAYLRVLGSNLKLKVLQDCAFEAGNFVFFAQGDTSGALYNTLGGNMLSPLKVVSGLESLKLSGDFLKTEGTDTEEDGPFRGRIKALWLSTAEGKAPLLYKIEAEKIDGVLEALVQRTPDGVYGRTRVILKIAKGKNAQDVCKEVDAHLRLHGLAANELLIIEARKKSVSCGIRYMGDLSEESLKIKLDTWAEALALGESMQIRELYKLSEALNLVSFEVLDPSSDQDLGEGEDLLDITFALEKEAVNEL